MKKIKYLLTLFFLFPLTLLAQQMISGKITDAAGRTGLPGVSIKVKGTATGTTTDGAGNFSLSVPGPEAYIQISFVGFIQQELQVKERTDFQIVLQEDNNSLDELVVIGYGTQKKATLTGSIATLKSEELTVTKNENVVNMLTGKIPGVRVLQKTSEPGAYENQFDIRGFGNPLIVIDGVPRGGGDLSRMDPNEIENISVLKDAAAAIYGVRAANGVILVTTKKGKKDGKYDINYSVNQGWQQFLGMPEGVGAVDYMLLTNEKTKRSFANNFPANQESTFSYGDIEPWMNGTYPSADWIGAAFNTTSPQIQHNMNVDGGTEKANYFFNLGYMKQDGLFKSGDLNYDRYNFRSNVNVSITKRIRAQVLTSGHLDQKNQPFQDLWTIFKYAWNQVPINQIYANNNPLYPNKMPDDANPVVITDASKVGYKKRMQKNFQGQLTLEYDIPGIDGLKAKGMYNYGYNADDNTDHKRMYNLYTYNAEQDTYGPSLVGAPAYINRAYANSVSSLTQLSLNYAKTFNDLHNVSALLLLEESHFNADNFYAQRNVSIPIDYLFGGEDTQQLGSMNVNGLREEATRSYIGRLNYDYKGKYLAEFSFRRDGSNKFKPGAEQWGFFPAGSVGWRISEENFFKSLVSPDLVSNLKVRLSYGQTGDDGATAFQYISGFNYPTLNPNDNSVWGYFFGGKFYNGAGARPLTNPDLTWFTAESKNIGVDFGMWKGKLEGSVDVFRRDMKGLLALRDVQLPGTVGVGLPQENLNSNRTEGVEILLNHRNKIGQVGYNIGGNFFTTRTMDRDVIQGRAGNEYSNWKTSRSNRYTSIWWGKTYEGQFQNYDQIFNHPVNTGGGNNNTIPGDYYYQDWNEDGVINEKDDQPIATKDIPLVNYGINMGLSYKNFDLNALFAGATSFYVQYAEQYAEPLMYGRSALTQFLDSWHTQNPGDNVFDPNTQWVSGNYPAMGSPIAEGTKAVQDASYLRLKTLELGYSVPALALAKVGIKRMRVYANAYNLLTITKLKNSDPEHPGQIPDAGFEHGLGGYKYPLNRTFNLGASISF
ncbi:SusC/RagA family TonB-linked outer membrane protein [Pedobacter psychroterrae]|uniref:TonB-dependent receptor n=1 Tax=Pedobacter psychroterrae TaxID=2530453 RepID=A0A4V2MKW6_9SPHI|nr:TonB-dependent receptor [Pedobacter psychroterrae]TCC99816.1 TonB-dependent receptor [Pedobacter psychroterrae]